MSITPIDVIKKYFELKSLEPEVARWLGSGLKDDDSRYYSFLELKALFKAYGLGKIKDFEKFEFVNKWPKQESEKIVELVKSKYDKFLHDLENEDKKKMYRPMVFSPHARQLQGMFQILWRYRVRVENLLQSVGAVMAASGLYVVAYDIIFKVNKKLRDSIEVIDDILGLAVSPGNKKYSRSELVKNYHYPGIDIREREDDWF